MASSASRTPSLLACLALAVLALRPIPALERALEWVLAPTRLLAETAAPVGWVQARAQRGAERALARAAQGDAAAHAVLEQAVLASALPSGTLAQRDLRVVHGEVVGRERGATDRLRVRVLDPRGLEPGLPVVHGDWYVGRVASVPGSAGRGSLAPDEIVVELITAAGARICARVGSADEQTCRLVVGGLAPRRDQDWLDVHNPTRRDVSGGTVEVFEPPSLGADRAALANGFLLGDLVADSAGDARTFGVRPGLDYRGGLYQVLVLAAPAAGPSPRARSERSVLADDAWRPARLVLRGSASPWRETHTLALGRLAGVRPGAALAAGARLFGRVERAGPLLSEVRSLGDAGFSVAALALVPAAHGPEPHVLGRITSLGRDADGAVLFEWPASVPLAEGADPVPAELWTGSGEPGMPRGLWIGTTELPAGAGPHRLRVHPGQGMRETFALRVRLPDHALLEELEGGGA